MRRIITTLATSGLILGFAGMPVYAQDANASGGQAIAACNRTAKDSLKSVRDSFKAGSITETERNTKVKDVETTRRSCVKSAREAAKTARDAKRAEMKAKMEAGKAEAKAKREQVKAAHTAKREAAKAGRKTSKVTPTPTPAR